MEDEEKKDYEFKIITLGNPGVGKTSIIKRYVLNEFSGDQISTLGIEYSFKDEIINGQNIKLSVIDTGGQEKYKSMSASYFRHADVVLFVFDWSIENSFKDMKDWIKHFEDNNNGKRIKKKYLIGNKNDLEKKVNQSEIDAFTKENNLDFMSTSAKEGDQINELFRVIATNLYDYIMQKKDIKKTTSQVSINIGPNNKKNGQNSKCC